MATQIFIEPELETLHENAEEWTKICEELGLQKQLQKSGKIEKVGNPYMKIDPRSERVYKMLCSAVIPYKEYDASTLPLEVLQEIRRCEENGWFHEIQIWYDDKSPDPFLVGVETKQWGSPKFLIARWGDELIPFEQMIAKAIDRFKTAYKRALDRLVMECEVRKQDIEGELKSYIDLGDNFNGFDFPRFQNPIR